MGVRQGMSAEVMITENHILNEEQLMEVFSKLKPRHAAFAREYVVSLNGGEAALKVGYSRRSKSSIASQLLANPYVKRYIQHLKAKQLKKTNISAAKILAELEKLAFTSFDDVFEFDGRTLKIKSFEDMPASAKAAISSMKIRKLYAEGEEYGEVIEIKLYDKVESLTLLGRHLKLFTDRIDISGETIVPVVNNNITINHRRAGEPLERAKEYQEYEEVTETKIKTPVNTKDIENYLK